MIRSQKQYLALVVVIAVCLVLLCALTAISILAKQQVLAKILRENVESRRAAVELEECLTDLIVLENDQVEKVSVLHDRVVMLIKKVRLAADQPEEQRLLQLLESGFYTYLNQWRALPPLGKPGHEEARKKATRKLQTSVLEPCQEFELYNAQRIEESSEQHEAVLKRLAWGLAAVGILGAISGALVGYGVASRLAQSILRLRVQIRDAVGKMEQDPAEIVLTGQGGLNSLHADLDQLTVRIERIIDNLRQREREVLRAEQLAAVGQLAAGVAHEIRNPLASIKMLIQAAQEDTHGLASDDLQVMEGEVRRMERSLQMFLDFARPPKPQWQRTQLAPLLQGVNSLFRGRADKQRVVIELNLPPGDVSAVIDPEQIRQVLVNLCLNGLDAMPTGGKLGLTLRNSSDGNVQIEVTDTGPGFPPALLPQLFQPFVSTKDSGLGLGLVISRRILEDHGGKIEAGNRPDGGACLLVTIPAEPVTTKGRKVHADSVGS